MKHSIMIETLLVTLVIYSIVRFGWLAVQWPGMIPNDYTMYHTTCDNWLQGQTVYRPNDPSPFKYSPTFLVTFCGTLHQVGKHAAWTHFAALSILALAWAMRRYWLWAFGNRYPSPKIILPAIAASLVLGWHGYLEQFAYGQVDFLLFGAVVAAALCSETRRLQPIAALLLGGVLVTKPQMAIFLAYFLLTNQFKTLLLTPLFTIILLLLPALGWGWAKHVEYFAAWKTCLHQQSAEFMTGNHNQSIAASIARIFARRDSAIAYTQIFLAVGVAMTVATGWRIWPLGTLTTTARARLFGCVTLLYLIITPLSWRWLTFMWIPIATVVLVDALEMNSRTKKSQLIFFGLFALVGIFRQKIVADAVGIREVDELSFVGFYTLGSLFLLVAAWLGFNEKLVNREASLET